MSKTTQIRTLAIEAGLPDTIQVTYHRRSTRWYLQYPLPLGPAAALGHATTSIGSYASIEEAQKQLPGDVATFFAAYGRLLAVLAGNVDHLTSAEASLLVIAHRSGGVSMPFDSAYRQLLDEGLVQTVPQLGTKAVIYRLTSLGERLIADHHAALRQQAGDAVIDTEQVTTPHPEGISDDDPSALHTILDQAERGQPIDQVLIDRARQYLSSLGDSAPRERSSGAEVVATVPRPWNQPTHRQTPVYQHTLTCAVCDETVTVQTHRSKPPSVCERENCRATYTRRQARERKRRQRARERQRDDEQETQA